MTKTTRFFVIAHVFHQKSKGPKPPPQDSRPSYKGSGWKLGMIVIVSWFISPT